MLYLFGLIGIIVFLFEHIGRINDFLFRPTYFINELYEMCKTLFTKFGVIFAQMSSWLYQLKEILYLKLEELAVTFFQLCKSIFELLITPLYFCKGYLDTVKTYLTDGYLIYIGSFFLFLLIVKLITNRHKIRNYFARKKVD